jgi:hypothetical protein
VAIVAPSRCLVPQVSVRSLDANLGRGTLARARLLFLFPSLQSMLTRFRRIPSFRKGRRPRITKKPRTFHFGLQRFQDTVMTQVSLVPQVRVRSLDANLGWRTLAWAPPFFPGPLRSVLTRFRQFPVSGKAADRVPRKNPAPVSLRSTALQGTVITQVSVQRTDASLGHQAFSHSPFRKERGQGGAPSRSVCAARTPGGIHRAASKRRVPRLHRIARCANDSVPLGMTVRER